MTSFIKQIVPLAAVGVMSLFSMNKTFAQAERSVLHTNVSSKVTALPESVKIMSDNQLDEKASTMSFTGTETDIIMIGDTVIVQDETRADWLKKQPGLLSQINQVRGLTGGLPKGSVVKFEVESNKENMDIEIYTQQAGLSGDRRLKLTGTPAQNLADVHYNINDFETLIKLNNLNNTVGQPYSPEELNALRAAEYQGQVKFDSGFKVK